MAVVNGFGQQRVIRDTRGRTDQQVGGVGNNVRYVGDSGANTFDVGGMSNNVDIRNIGRDERINLEGRRQDWVRVGGNSRDGQVQYVNKLTGNTVNLQTDAGRNDAFVDSKVRFTGDYESLGQQNPCCCNNWNQLGNMLGSALFTGMAMASMSQMWGGFGAGSWGNAATLPHNCWGVNLNVNIW